MKKAIIIGGGIGGCAAGYLLQKKGWDVSLFEQKSFLGGGLRTFFCGDHPYTIGPRPLYTDSKEAYDFLLKFIPMRPLDLYLGTFVEQDSQFYSFPIHEDDIPHMPDCEQIRLELAVDTPIADCMDFEEYYKASIGPTLYSKFIENYSKKMWGITSNTELTGYQWSVKGVSLQQGSRKVREDYIIAHPSERDGYNSLFDLLTKDISVTLEQKVDVFDLEHKKVKVAGGWIEGDIIISTTSIDLLMDYAYGELRYIGRNFMPVVLPIENALSKDIAFAYYAGQEPYTRIVEYKKLFGYTSSHTLLGFEFPTFENKMYPYPIKSEQDKAAKYLQELPENVFSIGRMGRYRYDNIGEVILQVKEVLAAVKST